MPGTERPPRALLPRISPEESITPELTSETSQGSQEATAPARVRTLPGARSNIRSACLACRQRRSKCSGGAPCGRCRTRGTDCVYEELQDRRTRAVREKGKEELDLHRKVIDGVFRAIKAGGNQTIFDLVRQNASLQTIAAAISDDSAESESDDLTQVSTESQTAATPKCSTQDSASATALWNVGHSRSSGSATTARIDSLAQRRESAYRRDEDGIEPIFRDEGSRNLTSIMGMPAHEPLLLPWMLKPVHDTELAPLDSLSHFYVQFRDGSRQMIARGMPADAIVGPKAISCNFFFRANQSADTFNLSTWAASVVNGLPELDGYFKLAWFVLLVRLMKWCIEPNGQTFAMIPTAMKPTPLQLSTPHAPFIDLLPLPEIRDTMITSSMKDFDSFTSALQIAGAGMYWQGSFEDAVHHDPISGNMTITDRFEKHVANADHYRFGRLLLRTFPLFEGRINVAEQDQIVAMPFVTEFT